MKKVKFNKNIYRNIRKNVKKYRRQNGMTSADLAETIGISNDFMRRLESEKSDIGFSFETLYKISVALGVTIDMLIQKN